MYKTLGSALVASQAYFLYRNDIWIPSIAPKKLVATDEQAKKPAVVIGSGVTGLATAYALARRNFDVVVLSEPETSKSPSSTSISTGTLYSTIKAKNIDVCSLIKDSLFNSNNSDITISWSDLLTDPFFVRWAYRYVKTYLGIGCQCASRNLNRSADEVNSWATNQARMMIEEIPDLIKSQTGITSSIIICSKEEAEGPQSPFITTGAEECSFETANKLEKNLHYSENQRYFLTGEAPMIDCEEFARSLKSHLERNYNVHFEEGKVVGFRTSTSTQARERFISSILTDKGAVAITKETTPIVAAVGANTGPLMDLLGVFVPIFPVHAQSLEVRFPAEQKAAPSSFISTPGVTLIPSPSSTPSLASDSFRAVKFTSLGGWSAASVNEQADLNAPVIESTVKLLGNTFPAAEFHIRHGVLNNCTTAVSADHLPYVGKVHGFANAYLNVTTSRSGWLAGIGFGRIVASLADGSDSHLKRVENVDVSVFAPVQSRLGCSFTSAAATRKILKYLPDQFKSERTDFTSSFTPLQGVDASVGGWSSFFDKHTWIEAGTAAKNSVNNLTHKLKERFIGTEMPNEEQGLFEWLFTRQN